MDYVEASSDDEYFPTTEELYQVDEEDEMITEEEEEDEDDEELALDPDYADVYDQGESEEEEEEEVVEENRRDRERSQGLLRQIQEVLSSGLSTLRDRDERPRRGHRALQALPTIPYVAGKHLLNSGEFGPLDDRTAKKRRFEGPRTITELARFRELGWKRENTVVLTKKWLPAERKGRIVAQYNRHVYSGQFSHDGSFFYTASQDFRCRMYSTLNPANPSDWKLFKVCSSCFSRRIVPTTNFVVDCTRRNWTLDNYRCHTVA